MSFKINPPIYSPVFLNCGCTYFSDNFYFDFAICEILYTFVKTYGCCANVQNNILMTLVDDRKASSKDSMLLCQSKETIVYWRCILFNE